MNRAMLKRITTFVQQKKSEKLSQTLKKLFLGNYYDLDYVQHIKLILSLRSIILNNEDTIKIILFVLDCFETDPKFAVEFV